MGAGTGDTSGSVPSLAVAIAFTVVLGVIEVACTLFDRHNTASSSWPVTTGRLVAFEVTYSGGVKGSGGYIPRVRYTYSVNGTEYESQHFTIADEKLSKGRAQDARARFVVGGAVEVHYDPSAQNRAVLDCTPTAFTRFRWLRRLVLSIFLAATWWQSWTKRPIS
jgi:hypothetical protein